MSSLHFIRAACNCNTTGTGGATQCDNDSGQCPCIGNYGGQLCDGCAYNYYNYESGCLSKLLCLLLVYVSFTSVNVSVFNLYLCCIPVETIWFCDMCSMFYFASCKHFSRWLSKVTAWACVLNIMIFHCTFNFVYEWGLVKIVGITCITQFYWIVRIRIIWIIGEVFMKGG